MRALNKQRLKRRAAEFLALPLDTLMDVPRVTCINGTDVVVENVRTLVRVAEHEVIVDVTDIQICVEGSQFEVTLVTDKEVHIRGQVDAIRYVKVNGRGKL
jgi:sporulation protein YqfC